LYSIFIQMARGTLRLGALYLSTAVIKVCRNGVFS